MKKILEKVKKYDIDIIILIILITLGASLLVILNCGDELWNFANAYKMYNGYKIYKDLNVIITPLFFYISQIFFKIFGASMFSFRIYNAFIWTIFFILIYKILKKLKIIRRRCVFYTILLMVIFNSMIHAGANYNIFSLIPILINILLILKRRDSNIITSILLFVTFLMKQNVFVYYSIGILIYKFVSRSSFKQFIITIIKIYLVDFIAISAFFIYLLLDNNLYNFINYCFLGIAEFGKENTFIDFMSARYLYISIAITIFILVIFNNKRLSNNLSSEEKYNSKVLVSFGIPLLLIQYPLANYYHSVLGSLVIIISFIYVIENILIKELKIKVKQEKILYIIITLSYLIYFVSLLSYTLEQINDDKILIEQQGVYQATLISENTVEDLSIITDFIQEQEKNGRKVVILSHKANLYNLNMNRNNGNFDLYFLGNLGKAGEKGLIDEIKEKRNILFLTQKTEENLIGQEALGARKYVIDNCEKVGEIQEYNIYYKK